MRRNHRIYILFFLLGLTYILFNPGVAFSHRVYVYAWVEGNRVFTESYSQDGKLLKNANIKVYTSDKTLLLEGKTNNKGEFSFNVDKPQELLIVLDLGDGHRAEYKLSKTDFTDTKISSTTKNEAIVSENKEPQETHFKKEKTLESAGNEKLISSAENKSSVDEEKLDEHMIRQIVREEMQKELKGVYKALGRIERNKPSVSDILGGIGYIVGLFGLYMAFKKGKRQV